MNGRFQVDFDGEVPEPLKVGDKLTISGTVTVSAISGDLADITSYGKDREYALSGVRVDLYSNRLEVSV